MRIVLTAAFAAFSGSALADPIDIQVDNFTVDRGIAELVLKVTNTTGADVTDVFIDCAFLDANMRAIDIGKALIQNIPAGGYAYDKAAIARTAGVQHAECRVVKYK